MIEEYLVADTKDRQEEWTGSIAVGGRSFLENVKGLLGIRAKGRDIVEGRGGYQLRESPARYKALFEAENDVIGLQNTHFWEFKTG